MKAFISAALDKFYLPFFLLVYSLSYSQLGVGIYGSNDNFVGGAISLEIPNSNYSFSARGGFKDEGGVGEEHTFKTRPNFITIKNTVKEHDSFFALGLTYKVEPTIKIGGYFGIGFGTYKLNGEDSRGKYFIRSTENFTDWSLGVQSTFLITDKIWINFSYDPLQGPGVGLGVNLL